MYLGIYCTEWEVGDIEDNPGELLINTPFKQVKAPAEVIKVKYANVFKTIITP